MATYGEQFDAAMKCQTVAEAETWLRAEVTRYCEEFGGEPAEAERIIKTNLGYMAGYYNHETAQKVQRLFGAAHPIFGTATYHQDVSPEKAFETGVNHARKI